MGAPSDERAASSTVASFEHQSRRPLMLVSRWSASWNDVCGGGVCAGMDLIPSAFAFVPIVLVAVLVLAGLRRWYPAIRLFRAGVRADGIVVGHYTSGANGLRQCTESGARTFREPISRQSGTRVLPAQEMTRYRPIVEFDTTRGERQTGSPTTAKPYPALVPGRRVTVYYDPAEPSTIAIAGYVGMRKVVVGALAVLLGLAGALAPGAVAPAVSMTALLSVSNLFLPFLLLGAFAVVLGAAGIAGTLRTRLGPQVSGTVVGHYECDSPQGLCLHHAIVRWTSCPDGGEVRVATGRGRLSPEHEIGRTVTVYQHPRDPHRILLSGDGPAPWAVGLLGGGAVLMATSLAVIISGLGFVVGG